jgi:hypothetical protein
MNKYYLIVPCALLLGFVGFEQRAEKSIEQKEVAWRAATAATNAAQEERRLIARREAEADARRHAAEREQQDRARADKKLGDYANLLRSLAEETDRQVAETEKLTRETAALERQLAELRTKRETSGAEAFALARHVEQDRVARRTAEIELQRTTKMVAVRISTSAWVNPSPTALPVR